MNRAKYIIGLISIILIIAVICGVFFLISHLTDRYDRMVYPKKYENLVSLMSSEYDVPEHIIYAVIRTESGFDENAVSPKGAVGLMQITPDTFDWLKTKTGEDVDGGFLSYPDVNIRYGVFFLKMLYEQFGNWETVWAAYNAGRSRVMGWLAEQNPVSQTGEKINELTEIPYSETKKYVKKVGAAAEQYMRIYYKAN